MAEIDYGPLTPLIGVWEGDQGMDIAPEPDGTEENPYYETLTFEAGGDVSNAESQTLAIVRYHQVVSRKSNDEVFHDQIGYWTWDPPTQTSTQSIRIPLVVAVLFARARRALDWLAGLTARAPRWTGWALIALGLWSAWFGLFVTLQ